MAEKAILEFRKATVVAPQPYEFGLEEVDLTLAGGELALVAVESGQGPTPLAEAALGLIEPVSGEVRFAGTNWKELPPGEAASARGRIGRVFRRGGWISNLNVDENITLPLRHHSELSPEEVYRRAGKSGKLFGLTELPEDRPALCPRATLQRAQWTRAFLGDPELIILEEPLRGAYSEMAHLLMKGIARALMGGAAILWINGELSEFPGDGAASLKRYRIKGPRLEPE